MTLELFQELAGSVLNRVLRFARQLCFSVHFLPSHRRDRLLCTAFLLFITCSDFLSFKLLSRDPFQHHSNSLSVLGPGVFRGEIPKPGFGQ